MKKLLPILTVAAIAMAPQIATDAFAMQKEAMQKEAMMEKKMEATVTAVAFHADWCGGCKILGPKMEEVMNNLDDETKTKFNLVKFDFTDDASKAATKAMAMEKGLASLYPEGKPTTGVIKLIAADGSQIAKINHTMSVEEITNIIKDATA